MKADSSWSLVFCRCSCSSCCSWVLRQWESLCWVLVDVNFLFSHPLNFHFVGDEYPDDFGVFCILYLIPQISRCFCALVLVHFLPTWRTTKQSSQPLRSSMKRLKVASLLVVVLCKHHQHHKIYPKVSS